MAGFRSVHWRDGRSLGHRVVKRIAAGVDFRQGGVDEGVSVDHVTRERRRRRRSP